MSRSTRPRPATTDDAGRPIVAELGRAETPDEIAERKAAASAKRRSNQTTINLVLALLASLGVVALVILVVVRPSSIERDPVDYAAVAADAQPSVDVPLVVPSLPAGWTSNRAELVTGTGDGIDSWQIGLLTPGEQYIGLVQGIRVDQRWVSEQTANADTGDTVTIGGHRWTIYDRRDAQDPGNLAYIMTTVSGDSTIVLGGTASDAEFGVLADAVGAELDAGGAS
ncbi:MAG TPA: DUF4245 family protein [Pseudolysinimonas sp.]